MQTSRFFVIWRAWTHTNVNLDDAQMPLCFGGNGHKGQNWKASAVKIVYRDLGFCFWLMEQEIQTRKFNSVWKKRETVISFRLLTIFHPHFFLCLFHTFLFLGPFHKGQVNRHVRMCTHFPPDVRSCSHKWNSRGATKLFSIKLSSLLSLGLSFDDISVSIKSFASVIWHLWYHFRALLIFFYWAVLENTKAVVISIN